MNCVCLLGINPKEVQKCNASECPTCGWDSAEAERRRTYLHEHGLTLCADGLRRLIIPKNGGNEEMKYKVCDHCGAHLDNGETCEYAEAVTANGGFIFLGCYHTPYRGKWVREIQKCPAKSEGEEK